MREFIAKSSGIFIFPDGHEAPCVLGKGGVVDASRKREGDGASPLGRWPIRRVFYRPDRLTPPETGLECVPLAPNDGWCDAPDHPLYNRPVFLPFRASHEKLWRDDHVYDLIVELGHNDSPPQAGLGSAIFMHLVRPDRAPTEGCIALALADLQEALATAEPGDVVWIST